MKHFVIIFILAVSLSQGYAVLGNNTDAVASAAPVHSEYFVQSHLFSKPILLFLFDAESDSFSLTFTAIERNLAMVMDCRKSIAQSTFEARVNRLLISLFFSGLSPPELY